MVVGFDAELLLLLLLLEDGPVGVVFFVVLTLGEEGRRLKNGKKNQSIDSSIATRRNYLFKRKMPTPAKMARTKTTTPDTMPIKISK